ncbi:hypothetical protein ACROYT_G026555 [Oculina patagonica]
MGRREQNERERKRAAASCHMLDRFMSSKKPKQDETSWSESTSLESDTIKARLSLLWWPQPLVLVENYLYVVTILCTGLKTTTGKSSSVTHHLSLDSSAQRVGDNGREKKTKAPEQHQHLAGLFSDN